MTRDEQLQAVFHQYQEAHQGVPHGTHEVVTWAVRHGLLELPELDPHAVLAERMASALRNEYGTDPQTGRRYRKNHAVRVYKRGVQLALWGEMATAPRDHMLKAFQQRRKQIVGDCVQLKADVDVYNARNPEVEPIQLVLDFTDDVAEVEAAEGFEDAA
jgi:hypothetical protein